jgi:hypothetical protein
MFDKIEVELDQQIDKLLKIIDKEYTKICLTFHKLFHHKPRSWGKKNVLQFVNSILKVIFRIPICKTGNRTCIYNIRYLDKFDSEKLFPYITISLPNWFSSHLKEIQKRKKLSNLLMSLTLLTNL